MSSQTYSNSIESSKTSGFKDSTLEKAISTIKEEHEPNAGEIEFLQSLRRYMNQPDILEKKRSTEEHMRWSFTERFFREELPWEDPDRVNGERLRLLALIVADIQQVLMGLTESEKDTKRYNIWLRGTNGARIPGLRPFIPVLYELYLN
jgi:hypothetical protein